MRRLLMVGSTLALVGLVNANAYAADDNGKSKDLTLWATETLTSYPDDPPEAGDSLTFTATIYEDEDRDDEVGRNDGVCTVTEVEGDADKPDSLTFVCYGTLQIDDKGSLSWSGSATMEDESPDSDEPFITLAITGGTGDYKDAGGYVEVFDESDDGDEGDQRYEAKLLHLK